MKVLINNREDFNNWCECNGSFNHISYEEYVPKYYPCIVSFRFADSDDLYYEFVYLQDFSELDEDNEEFSDYEPEFIAINKEDISIGDYIGIECERFEGDSCHLRIVDIQQRYNEITGEPYEPETISEIVPHPEKFNPKTQPCVLTNHGIVTDIIKFD